MKLRCSNRQLSRRAFTIIELLVTIAILGLLAAVLMPAIQSVRESGRQTECRSHLHQFGLALGGFEATHRRLPAHSCPRIKGTLAYSRFSTHVQLLPYFEQKSLYETIDFAAEPPRILRFSRLTKAINDSLGIFACPSDSVEGGNNYRVSQGARGHGCKFKNDCPDGGAFSLGGGTALADVQDGLSHSAAVSERYKSDHDTSSFSLLDFWYSGLAVLTGDPSREEMIAVAEGLAGTPSSYYPRVGHQWLYSGYAATSYNHLLQPNSAVLDCSMDARDQPTLADDSALLRPDTLSGVFSARSHHPAGVHVLMLDGAVDLASNNTDLQVWREVGTIASQSR